MVSSGSEVRPRLELPSGFTVVGSPPLVVETHDRRAYYYIHFSKLPEEFAAADRADVPVLVEIYAPRKIRETPHTQQARLAGLTRSAYGGYNARLDFWATPFHRAMDEATYALPQQPVPTAAAQGDPRL